MKKEMKDFTRKEMFYLSTLVNSDIKKHFELKTAMEKLGAEKETSFLTKKINELYSLQGRLLTIARSKKD